MLHTVYCSKKANAASQKKVDAGAHRPALNRANQKKVEEAIKTSLR